MKELSLKLYTRKKILPAVNLGSQAVLALMAYPLLINISGTTPDALIRLWVLFWLVYLVTKKLSITEN